MSISTEPPGTDSQTHDGRDFEDRPPTARQDEPWRDWMMIGVGNLHRALDRCHGHRPCGSHLERFPLRRQRVCKFRHRRSPTAQVAPALKPEYITLGVKADTEHGRRGPDGKWHDAFLPADFTLRAGHKVTITVNNYDDGAHTFTSPAMGVNAIISGGGSLSAPHTMKFTFRAPTKPGRYAWWCAVPCDPWAMAHDGFMRGFVTVKA